MLIRSFSPAGLAIVCVLGTVVVSVNGCFGPGEQTPGGASTPSLTAPSLPGRTETLPLGPSPPPVETLVSSVSPGGTSTPLPLATPVGSPTPVPPTRLGSSIRYLLRLKETGQIKPGSEEERVIKMMDARGGAVVTVLFDHELSQADIDALQSDGLMKFFLPLGSQTPARAVHSGAVPWRRLRELANRPDVRVVDTELWPPRQPAR